MKDKIPTNLLRKRKSENSTTLFRLSKVLWKTFCRVSALKVFSLQSGLRVLYKASYDMLSNSSSCSSNMLARKKSIPLSKQDLLRAQSTPGSKYAKQQTSRITRSRLSLRSLLGWTPQRRWFGGWSTIYFLLSEKSILSHWCIRFLLLDNQHPQQAMVLQSFYATLTVKGRPKKSPAHQIMIKMSEYSHELLDQVMLVSQELNRIAITWAEMWYNALEVSF